MRAVLIVNPTATSTTPAGRDLLANALKSRLQLTVVHTTHRGHAGEIAQAAARDGVDVIVVHGGDGTVSNVVNGLLGTPGQLPTGHIPAVAIVPGGSANVVARSLGDAAGPDQGHQPADRIARRLSPPPDLAPHRGDRLRRAVVGAQRRHGSRRRSGGRGRGATQQRRGRQRSALSGVPPSRLPSATPAANRC